MSDNFDKNSNYSYGSNSDQLQNFMLGNYGTNALSVTLEPASQPVSPGTVTPYTAPSSYPSHWQDDDLSSVPQATSFVPGWQDGYVPPAPPAPALPR